MGGAEGRSLALVYLGFAGGLMLGALYRLRR
jgi:hypothetical protein